MYWIFVIGLALSGGHRSVCKRHEKILEELVWLLQPVEKHLTISLSEVELVLHVLHLVPVDIDIILEYVYITFSKANLNASLSGSLLLSSSPVRHTQHYSC